MNLDAFDSLVKSRRATRHFKPDALPEGLLHRLLSTAQWAPSGYNLQPTHFVVVTDVELKKGLLSACLDQSQVLEAPATVIFCGDRRVKEFHFEKTLAADNKAGAINADYEKLLRKFVPLAFDKGPLGLGWLWKTLLPPFGRFVRPIPQIPAADMDYWLAKQVALSAMVFMLAAQSAGLSTVPMEGFDEIRIRTLLKLPPSIHVAVVIPVGYSATGPLKKTRLPLGDVLHENGW